MKKVALIVGAAVLAVVSIGCQSTDKEAAVPQQVESAPKFQLMDPGVQNSVAIVQMRETTLADGRLQVAANVRNRENRRIQVQANCEFQDEQGFALDSTPWETLILTENAQETIHFASANDKAKRYTLRIREAR